MTIIAIAWIYVVGLMAITEGASSVVGGIMTFLLYCVFPLSVVTYIGNSGKRRRKRQAEEQARRDAAAQTPAEPPSL
ncbi:MAG TPA: hypothetical protein VIT92_08850 [Burkholderiaceae bacterium]